MSATWNATLAPRARRSRSRGVRVPPLLAALGRALVYLAWAALMAWAILFRPTGLAAQVAPEAADVTVASGDRVRVLSPALGTRPVETRVLALRGDTLVLSGMTGADGIEEPTLVPVSSIHALDVSRGTKSNAWKGAKIGAAVGAALGLVAGIVAMSVNEDCPPDKICLPVYDVGAEAIPAGMLGVGLLGGLIGTGIGALSRSERWESVPPARIRVEPRPGGAAVVASVTLRL